MATVEKKPAQDEKQQQNGEVDTAAEASEQLGIDAPDSTYSLELSQDQKDIREWAHGFAEQTSCAPPRTSGTRRRSSPGRSCRRRPRSGSTASSRSRSSGPTRPGSPSRSSTRSSSGATPGSAWRSSARRWRSPGIFGSGTPEQLVEWVPQCFGDADDVKVGGLLRLRARRRLRRLRLPHHRQVRRGQGRVGDQRPEGLGDQRRHRQRPRGDRLGRPRAGLARPRRLRHPAGHQGPRAGRQGEEARHPRLAHRRRPPGRLPRPRLLPARRQGEARRAARQGPRGQELQGPGGDADLRALAPDGRRAGGRHRPRRLRVRARLRQGARGSSAARSSRTRRSPSRSPT